jgi:hypothetical protein
MLLQMKYFSQLDARRSCRVASAGGLLTFSHFSILEQPLHRGCCDTGASLAMFHLPQSMRVVGVSSSHPKQFGVVAVGLGRFEMLSRRTHERSRDHAQSVPLFAMLAKLMLGLHFNTAPQSKILLKRTRSKLSS